MHIRTAILKFGRELKCHRNLGWARVVDNQTMPEVVGDMDDDKRRQWTNWISKRGPFWIDERQHPEQEMFIDKSDEFVTNTGLGEAGYCITQGRPHQAVSLAPSNWMEDPINVRWLKDGDEHIEIPIKNHTAIATIEHELGKLPKQYDSWETLANHLRRRCDNLIFPADFMRMKGFPFKNCVAELIQRLVLVLDEMSGAFDDDGNKTDIYKTLHATYFESTDSAYFKPESDSNIEKYGTRMTFSCEENEIADILCHWHGHVNVPTSFPPIRIHFSWPVTQKGRLFLPYIGRKITTR